MFDNKKVLENMVLELNSLSRHYLNLPVSTQDMLAVSNLENQINALRDIVFAKYNESDAWAQSNYLSAKSAIVHETHQERRSITKSIARGKLLKKFDSLKDAVSDNLISSDHIDLFTKIKDNKYLEYLDRDIDLLVENAIKLDALHFSYVIKYWKNIIDDQLDEQSDEYKQYNNRRLFLNEISDGTWIINGQLDVASGMLLNKALENIVDKLWRNDSIEQRINNTRSSYRCDALGYLAHGFINASNSADAIDDSNNSEKSNGESVTSKRNLVDFNFTAPITSDITIEIEQLNENKSARLYLQNTISKTSPIHKTHATNLIKQLLCDSVLSAPIIFDGGVIDMGRNVRIAPTNMKKQLAVENNTCTIDGCSIPASWCDAHHIHHWLNGGETKIENLTLLCRRHHTMMHNDKAFAEKISRQLSLRKTKSKSRVKSPPQFIRTG